MSMPHYFLVCRVSWRHDSQTQIHWGPASIFCDSHYDFQSFKCFQQQGVCVCVCVRQCFRDRFRWKRELVRSSSRCGLMVCTMQQSWCSNDRHAPFSNYNCYNHARFSTSDSITLDARSSNYQSTIIIVHRSPGMMQQVCCTIQHPRLGNSCTVPTLHFFIQVCAQSSGCSAVVSVPHVGNRMHQPKLHAIQHLRIRTCNYARFNNYDSANLCMHDSSAVAMHQFCRTMQQLQGGNRTFAWTSTYDSACVVRQGLARTILRLRRNNFCRTIRQPPFGTYDSPTIVTHGSPCTL
jgi:hypothetical protein